ncbi:hypothetical protein [Bradyrhizobium sp.]|jgi:hypothetical protein|uniref:hypothetical protein n=1 Tax=Bradyrhizobium sp. TaxID=376 RepID=UPI002E0ABBA3|nr:hypothetical protein [Bradyrhizobium sp.]
MGWFGWRAKDAAAHEAAPSGPQAILEDLAKRVPQYVEDADQGRLIYPACKRTVSEPNDVRTAWDDTRLEAMRYVMVVPRREFELLADPDSQSDLLNAFLCQPPHEDTVIDFTGSTMSDIAISVFAGFNWLNHCAVLAGADRGNVSGTLHRFRKLVILAQQWWAMEGAGPRCRQMLANGEEPPLMLYLVWTDYTRLAKEIAAAMLNRSIRAAAAANAEALARAMTRLQDADDPADLGIR